MNCTGEHDIPPLSSTSGIITIFYVFFKFQRIGIKNYWVGCLKNYLLLKFNGYIIPITD